jgi:serralysin
MTVKATGETLIMQSGPYQVEFANGTVWTSTNLADIAAANATSSPGAPIVGSDTAEALLGTSLGEYILAYGGADTLTGGGGADTLMGGTGNDRFVFTALSDSPTSGQDRISGFVVGDLIDLSGIDADAVTGGDQAFSFIGTAAFSAAGQLRYANVGGVLQVTGDVDGDGTADFRIDVTGVSSLASSDFTL